MNRIGTVCFENSCIEVEIPMTQKEREIGLMNRAYLHEDSGMIFIFDSECINKIWMKNMLIPLDIIWLDYNGFVIHIDKNVMPCYGDCQSFGPESCSKFAIEVNGLYTDRHNINIGDNVRMIL